MVFIFLYVLLEIAQGLRTCCTGFWKDFLWGKQCQDPHIATIVFILWFCVAITSQEINVYTGSLGTVRVGFSKVSEGCTFLSPAWKICYFQSISKKSFSCRHLEKMSAFPFPVELTTAFLSAEGDLMDCDGKSDSSPEREAADDDTKVAEGADGIKKRKRKPYRPGRMNTLHYCVTCFKAFFCITKNI